MNSRDKLKIAGGAAGVLLMGTAAFAISNKQKDRKSALFFSELERKISPESAGITDSDAFDIHYWQNVGKKLKKSYYLLTQKVAEDYAKTIGSAWGIFDDDEEKVYGVFRALKDQVHVSQVADKYYLHNKINLIDDLKTRLDKEEVAIVMNIVNKLPPYRLADNKK